MKHLKIVFILVAVFFSLCYSCKKDHLVGEYLLTDEMKAQNPYQKGDSFILISNKGDTLSWFVKGRSNQIHEVLYSINANDYYLVENDKATIKLENNTEYVTFQLEMGGQLLYPPMFTINLHHSQYAAVFSSDLPLSKKYIPYIDSLYVRHRWIKDVFVHETALENTMYYSTQYGIVKIEFSDGSFWELESIEWAERE
ncbi:MAG: hypothetical protein K9G61_11670 [Bacteroidales bacterium]|nr:hypothetical protein [Bacteroidales bacterium]